MKEEIEKQFPDKSVTIEWMILDLASFRSTKDFTVAFKERSLPLHVLINNGGIGLMSGPLSEFKRHSLRSKMKHLRCRCLGGMTLYPQKQISTI